MTEVVLETTNQVVLLSLSGTISSLLIKEISGLL